MRKKDDRLQACSAGICRHGCGGVTGGYAGHNAFAQQPGLRNAAGHSVVFERSGWIESLMFKDQSIQPGISGRDRRFEQGCVPFPQRDRIYFASNGNISR